MAKARRTFTPEFKVQAVQLITEQDKSVAEVARDLDLGESMLRSWKQALAATGAQAFPGHGNPPALGAQRCQEPMIGIFLINPPSIARTCRPMSPIDRESLGNRRSSVPDTFSRPEAR